MRSLSLILNDQSKGKDEKIESIKMLINDLVGENTSLSELRNLLSVSRKKFELNLTFVENVVKFLKLQPIENETMKTDFNIIFTSGAFSHLLKLLLIMQMTLENPSAAERNDNFKNAKLNFRLRDNCIEALNWISLNKNLNEEEWKSAFDDPNAISILFKYIRRDPSIAIVLPALYTIYFLLKSYSEVKWFENSVKIVDWSDLVACLQKGFFEDKVKKWIEKGMESYEKERLIKSLDTKQGGFTKSDLLSGNFREKLVKDLHRIISNCILKIIDMPESKKNLQKALQDSDILPFLMEWVHNIPLGSLWEENNIISSLRLIRILIEDNAVFASNALEFNNFLNGVRLQIKHPEPDIVAAAIYLVSVLMETVPSLRKTFCNDKVILNAILDNYYAVRDSEIGSRAIMALCTMIDENTADLILKNGFCITDFLKLSLALSNSPEIVPKVLELRDKLADVDIKEWQKQETKFEEILHSSIKSLLELKREGNVLYNKKKYNEAKETYTNALLRCPPFINKLLPREDLNTIRAEYGLNIFNADSSWWFPLPAQLLANRAQCYLKLSQFENVIDDCSKAIAMCNLDRFDGQSLSLKCVYRRANAELKLGMFQEALRDAAFASMVVPFDFDMKNFFVTIYQKYRQECGNDFTMKRCVFCMKTDEENLIKCNRCTDHYCSKNCKTAAWNQGHNLVCNKK